MELFTRLCKMTPRQSQQFNMSQCAPHKPTAAAASHFVCEPWSWRKRRKKPHMDEKIEKKACAVRTHTENQSVSKWNEVLAPLCFNSIKKRFNWWWQSTEYSMSVARQFVVIFLNKSTIFIFVFRIGCFYVRFDVTSLCTAASIIWRIFHWIR